jgi:hypothetical protein
MLQFSRTALTCGLLLPLLAATAGGQNAKKENAASGAVEEALEQAKQTGRLILAVGGSET